MSGKPYFRGINKTKLREAIRAFLAHFEFRAEFECDLLSDLIHQRHYFCSVANLMPEKFRKMFRVGGGYDFEGCFAGRWHRVSWTQCIDQRDDRDWLTRALRDAARPFVADHKRKHPTCESCQAAAAEEVDHVSPEFHLIAAAAIAELSSEDIRRIILSIDWWNEEAFRLPPDSPAYAVLETMHSTATLQAVCHLCHLANAAARKTD